MRRFFVTLLLIAAASFETPAAPAGDRSPVVQAETLLARSDTLAAIRVLERGHRSAPEPGAAILLGQLHRSRGTIAGRLRSQQVLEAARARFHGDTRVSMELGRTYFAQRFYPDAISCFRDVLRRDPHCCDARYMIGLYHFLNWKRMNEYTDDLDVARRELRAVAQCDPDNADAAFKYLVTRYALRDTSAAECNRLVSRFPGRGEFWLYRGTLAYEDRRFADCESDYVRGLALVDNASRAVYGDLGQILSYRERDALDAVPFDERDAAQRAFWLDRDPDPTTPLNERSLEHIHRVFVADILFSSEQNRKRGWETDRGATYLKFGPPMAISQTLGDDNRSGKVETWSYVLGGKFLQFMYVDEYLNGNPRIPYTLDVTLSFLGHSSIRSGYRSPVLRLPGRVDVAAFRDDDMTSSAYLAVSVDADSVRAVLDLARVSQFVLRGAYFTAEWLPAGSFCDSVSLDRARERWIRDGSAFEVVRRIRLPFDRYHVACAFEDDFPSARASMRADADASRFLRDGLSVSDILLVRLDGARAAAIRRGDRTVWPRIDARYAPGEKLRAYVELYDLSLSGGASSYDVRFAIYPADDDGSAAWREWGRRVAEFAGLLESDPSVSQTFARQGYSRNDHESIAVDIDSLPPGRYQLVIEITDRRSGASAVAHKAFEKEAARLTDRTGQR